MKKIAIAILLVATMLTLVGCTEADKVSTNLSNKADNFEEYRRITVINCLQGETLFQMTGLMSIQPDPDENQLEVIVKEENGSFKKHFIGLSNNVTYVVEDITSSDVSSTKYTLYFNPDMWFPYEVEIVDPDAPNGGGRN